MTGPANARPGRITLVMAGLIAAGYADLEPLSVLNGPRIPAVFVAALWGVIIAPFLPLACALMARYAPLRLPGVVLVAGTICTAVLGALITLIAMMDGISAFVFLEGSTLTLAVAGGLQMLGGTAGSRKIAALLMALPTLTGLWSLATVPAVALSALRLADGRPYCIGHHGVQGPLESWAELRGLSLYTTRTGYKSTSHWYLHAVLIVQEKGGTSVWNWSFGAMSFTPLPHPGRLLVSAGSECTPEPGFLAALAPV